MIDPRRAMLYRLVLLLLLLGCVIWSYGIFSKSRADAVASAQDVAICDKLGKRVQTLLRKPALAGSSEMQFTEMTRRIEQAALAAECPTGSLQHISPDSEQRVGDSVYKEKPTSVTLKQVTLKQLIVFLHTLTADGSGLEVHDLRLAAPRDLDSGDRWTAELTLAYLIYSPPTNNAPIKTALGN